MLVRLTLCLSSGSSIGSMDAHTIPEYVTSISVATIRGFLSIPIRDAPSSSSFVAPTEITHGDQLLLIVILDSMEIGEILPSNGTEKYITTAPSIIIPPTAENVSMKPPSCII